MRCLSILAAMLLPLLLCSAALAQLQLRDIVRIKGQEENTLQGLGLVVGLNGNGDKDFSPTSRALATLMKHLGSPVGQGARGEQLWNELKEAKNVALVFVTATVPATGARQGDKLDCQISAIGAKSLEGGFLLPTPLVSSLPGNERVYAFAQGALHLENAAKAPRVAKIKQGCRLEENFFNVYMTNEGQITLVLDTNHAGFQNAQDIAEMINDSQRYSKAGNSGSPALAKAIDAVNIVVQILPQYREDPVAFLSELLSQRFVGTKTEARVVVNERAESVIVGADVEIGAVVITHKNLVIDAGSAEAGKFVPLDPAKRSTKLQSLVDALSAVKVPTRDIIDIIKGLDRNGKLYGKLIVE